MAQYDAQGLVNPSVGQLNESVTLQPGQTATPGWYPAAHAASPGSGSQSYTTPGSYSFTVPSGVTRILMWWIGGGGGGGGGYSTTYTGGWGGGPGASMGFVIVTPGDVLSITIGSGGTGGTGGSSPTAGGNGVATTIQSKLAGWTATSAYGAGGGAATSTSDGTDGGGTNATLSSTSSFVRYWGGSYLQPNASVESAVGLVVLSSGAISQQQLFANYGVTSAGETGKGGPVNTNGGSGGNGAVVISW